jgi:hypothetical protein
MLEIFKKEDKCEYVPAKFLKQGLFGDYMDFDGRVVVRKNTIPGVFLPIDLYEIDIVNLLDGSLLTHINPLYAERFAKMKGSEVKFRAYVNRHENLAQPHTSDVGWD